MPMPVQGDSYSPPPYPPPAPFKPNVVVVVAILTTVFSITFLLLLYAKHCKRSTSGYGGSPGYNAPLSTTTAAAARKNSGVRRAVVESLPVFRFGSLRGPKDGLECAVCLSRFETSEVLKLLPKCKHAFHVECVDTWLDAHSTCPLCRYRVDPEDILLVQDHSNPLQQQHQSLPNEEKLDEGGRRTQRVSDRHSSAGELRGNNKLLQTSSASRRSLDSRTKPSSSSQVQINQKMRLMKTLTSSSSLQPNQIHAGCFDKQRKDGLLLDGRHGSFEKRFEHRIMISNEQNRQQQQQRWSDLQPSDLIYLRSEMIINESNRRYSSGRIVINNGSASEIVGVGTRGRRRSEGYENRRQRRNGHVLSRWLAWANVSIPDHRQAVDQSIP